MTAESEVFQRLTRRQWTPHHPTLELSHDNHYEPQHKLFGQWSTSESMPAVENLHDLLNDLAASDVPRPGLMHSCEKISEQLLQIRDELQDDDCSPEVVRLKVFED